MDDKGFGFEQRKNVNRPANNNNNNSFNEIEFSKGGDGEGENFSKYGYVKSQVFSRECFSDPQNPGKIICKETSGRKGYDPFNPSDINVLIFYNI